MGSIVEWSVMKNVSEPGERTIEIMQPLWDCSKRSKFCVIGVLGEQENRLGQKNWSKNRGKLPKFGKRQTHRF